MDKLTKKERKEQAREEREALEQKLQKQETMKRYGMWGAIAAVILLSVIGLIKLASISEAPKNTTAGTTVPMEITSKDITAGSESAKVTIVEYADFQCPACGAYYPIVKQIKEEYPEDVRVVFRHFPLMQIHRNAFAAHLAAQAAHQQGKFWEMHDMLFETQQDWSEANNASDIFESYAQELGLDMKMYEEAISVGETREFINNQVQGGVDKGVNSTPTFFVNGEKIENPRGFDEFKQIIESKLK